MAPLLRRWSRYNAAGAGARYREDPKDPESPTRKFKLTESTARVFDGFGREIARVGGPVELNSGTKKKMDLDPPDGKPETYVLGWRMPRTGGGSATAWIRRSALKDPPAARVDPRVNPAPPRKGKPVAIDADRGRRTLTGLYYKGSSGKFRDTGNRGADFGGRNDRDRDRDYVNLLFSAPNVPKGAIAKDTIPDGARFVPGLSKRGRPIRLKVKMYRDRREDQEIHVHFVYGRAENGDRWGWIAQANVGHIPLEDR